MPVRDSTRTQGSTGYIEPLPPLPGRQQPRRQGLRGWVIAFGLATLAAGGAATWLFAPSSADAVTSADIEQRAIAFARQGPVQLPSVPPAEQAAHVAQMDLPAPAQTQLQQALQSAPGEAPPLRLIELSLWDTHAPDGDVVRITSAGYSRDVVLRKQPVVLAIPVQGNQPILIVGVRDGGGGITLGLQGGATALATPILSEGQTLTLPLAAP